MGKGDLQKRLAFFTGNLYNYKAIDAGVAELADAPDLGSGRRLCRFKSCRPHHPVDIKKIFAQKTALWRGFLMPESLDLKSQKRR